MCNCVPIELHSIAPLSISDYLENVNIKDCEYMCQKHHPFFYYFAGIIQYSHSVIQESILHAYFHIPTKTLKIVLNRTYFFCDPQLFYCGINKAWNKFNNVTDLKTQVYESLRGKLYTNDNFSNKIYHANKNIIKNLMNETFFHIDSRI